MSDGSKETAQTLSLKLSSPSLTLNLFNLLNKMSYYWEGCTGMQIRISFIT